MLSPDEIVFFLHSYIFFAGVVKNRGSRFCEKDDGRGCTNNTLPAISDMPKILILLKI